MGQTSSEVPRIKRMVGLTVDDMSDGPIAARRSLGFLETQLVGFRD